MTSIIDIEKLLTPISDDNPCGENLEYDADYAEMAKAAEGKGDQQFGKTVIAAEEPDWKTVRSCAMALLQRSKDLRISEYLIRSSIRMEGLEGFSASLAVMHGLVERFWPTIHPQLDPDDDNDPTGRVNIIASLCDPLTTLRAVREMPMVKSKVGIFSYRDLLVARGEMPPPASGVKTEMSSLDAAFAECDPTLLLTFAEAAKESLRLVMGIESAVTDQVGTSNAPNLEDLRDMVRGINKTLQDHVQRRGLNKEPEPEVVEVEEVSDSAPNGSSTTASSASQPMRITGEISSREDVIRTIDKLCEYYRRYEPSSPVPLFLNRAKRLASKSFLDILRDLTPDALAQALSLGGITDASELGVDNDDM
jgi:type VI secretion system protein ImpA